MSNRLEFPVVDIWVRYTILLSALAAVALFVMPEGGPVFWDLLQRDEKTILPFFLAGTLLLALPVTPMQRTPCALVWIGEHPGVIAVGTAIVLCVLSLSVYHGQPLTQDEYAPWFQAHIFAEGRIFATYTPEWLGRLFAAGYHGNFFIIDWRTGEVASGYWPGQALLMTPFVILGAPWAFNPVITGATVYVLWLLARDLFSCADARAWVILFALASPVFLINGVSFYAMPAHLLASLAYSWLLLGSAPGRILAAGFVGSLALLLHNPVPHILYCLPWIVWLAIRDDRGVRNVLTLAIGYAPLSILLGFGWASLRTLHTCSPECAAGSVGAVAASTSTTIDFGLMLALAKSLFVPPDMRLLELRTAAAIKVWMSAVPGLVVLAWLGLKRPAIWPLRLFAASAALTFAGYFFVPFSQGHGWGYRYFHSAWGALPLLAAAAMQESSFANGRRSAIVLRSILFSLTVLVGSKLFVVHRFVYDHWQQMPSTIPGASEIVFKNKVGYWGIDVVQNKPDLSNTPIVLISRGLRADRKFVESALPGARLTSMSWYGNTFQISPSTNIRNLARPRPGAR